MRKVVSRDGTTIAYEVAGEGPPIVLLGGGFRDHTAFATLVPVLAPHCTTYVYDRRGRGESGDAPTWSLEREIEDLAAVISEAGGEAAVFGGSSGGILALETALAGAPITKLALLEPPFRMEGYVDGEPPPPDFEENLRALLAGEKRGEAAELFLAQVAGFSRDSIAEWRRSPMWPANEAMAHTLLYDTNILDIRLEPDRVAKLEVPTIVIHSDQTSPWLRAASQATAEALPNGKVVELPGVWHRVPPETLGPALIEFIHS